MKNRLWALVAAFLLIGTTGLCAAGPDTQWVGVLWTKGSVDLGSTRVSSGTTVLPGDVIATGPDASAWVRFKAPASAILLSGTEVALFASASGFSLHHGTVIVDEKLTDPMQVAVPGGYVVVTGDPQNGAECELASLGNISTISVKKGEAEVHGNGAPVVIRSGQSARLNAGPQGGLPVAGKINKEIPAGVVQRQGETKEIPLTLNQTLDWNDLIRTLKAGRAQIMLLDGSTLNVGARSELRILKHDPQAQQTELELTLGRVEAHVQKITAPGGKFELHTKSAVIGTIDTSYVLSSDDKGATRVCGVDGTTLVRSSDPNITKSVQLHRSECTTVLPGMAPTDPVFSPTEMASMTNQTAIGGGAAGAGSGGGAAGGGLGLGGTTAIAIGIAAGAGAALAGVVLSSTGYTSPVGL